VLVIANLSEVNQTVHLSDEIKKAKKILGDKATYDPHIVLNPYELVIWKVVK
jgi:hypothetical protein